MRKSIVVANSLANKKWKTLQIVGVSVVISACLIAALLWSAGFVTQFLGSPSGTPDTRELLIGALEAIIVPVVGLVGASIGFYFGSKRLK